MWDNIFGAWLWSFENESWIVVSQEKILWWIISDLRRPLTWFKSKFAHLYLQPLFNALHMLSALRLAYLTCCVGHWVTESTRTGSLDDVKTHHTHIFLNKITYSSYCDWWASSCNPFWWNNHLFIVRCAVYSLFQVDLYSARHWLLISISVTTPTNITQYCTLWSWYMRKRIDHWCSVVPEKSQPSGPTIQWETWQALFPTGTVGPRVGIFLEPLNTNDGFYLSSMQ